MDSGENHIRHTLAASFAAGEVSFLFIDVQSHYFDRDHLKIRGASENARVYMPSIARRIGNFANTARRKAGDLSAIFAVHILDRQMRHCAHNPDTLRSDIVVPTTPADIILPKESFCAFHKTDLDKRLKKAGTKTLVVAGGMLEDCVSATIATATRDLGLNAVLMTDLTASRHRVEKLAGYREAMAGLPPERIGYLRARDVLEFLPRAA